VTKQPSIWISLQSKQGKKIKFIIIPIPSTHYHLNRDQLLKAKRRNANTFKSHFRLVHKSGWSPRKIYPRSRSNAQASAAAVKKKVHHLSKPCVTLAKFRLPPKRAASTNLRDFSKPKAARTQTGSVSSAKAFPKAGLHSTEKVIYSQTQVVYYKDNEKIVEPVKEISENVSAQEPPKEKTPPPAESITIDSDDDDVILIEDDIADYIDWTAKPPPPPQIEGIRIFGKAIENIGKKIIKCIESFTALDPLLRNFITKDDFQILSPEITTSPSFFSIRILDISSPSRFTFQFGIYELREFVTKMQIFYDGLEGIEVYQARRLTKDMVVAVRHDKNWFRAQVVSFKGENVEISLVDCMTLKTQQVPKEDVFYLHNSFVDCPQKSALGCVHGIKEANDIDWTLASNNEFYKLSTTDSLSASVLHFKNVRIFLQFLRTIIYLINYRTFTIYRLLI
jgi:hypothetical protein